jgi:hypothetical protein
MKKTTFITLTAASMTVTFLATSPAGAHANLVSADPKADATVAAPQSIVLHFSEGLAPKFSSLDLTKDGKKVALAPLTFDAKEKKDMTAAPQTPLAPGVYKVTWHVVASDDLHKTEGSFSFTVK